MHGVFRTIGDGDACWCVVNINLDRQILDGLRVSWDENFVWHCLSYGNCYTSMRSQYSVITVYSVARKFEVMIRFQKSFGQEKDVDFLHFDQVFKLDLFADASDALSIPKHYLGWFTRHVGVDWQLPLVGQVWICIALGR